MSAIFGYFSKKALPETSVKPLLHWNRPYGDGDAAFAAVDGYVLGCAQRHISKIIPRGQAVLQKDHVTAVIDALLYNRDELQSLLNPEDISDLSDEEVVLEVWRKKGAEGLAKINGDFAGAVVEDGKLTLFRDHLGVRPLHIYQDENMVVFSTDIRGILSMEETDNRLDERFLYAQLSGWYIDNSVITDFENIKAVRPACVMTVNQNLQAETEAFWRLGQQKIRCATEKEYQDKMRELVYDSIRRRLAVAEGGVVGAELSGGLDSTVIDVILKEMGADLRCFSWSPPLEEVPMQPGDEREIIEETCKQFGLSCKYGGTLETLFFVEKPEKSVPDMNVDIITFAMKYFQSEGAKIAFSGWGGDEGVSHRANPMELYYHGEKKEYFQLMWARSRRPLKAARFLKNLATNMYCGRKRTKKPWNYYHANHSRIPPIIQSKYNEIWKDKVGALPLKFPVSPVFDIEKGANRARTENGAVVGADYGVQYVFPFLDYRVENFAVSIPRYLYHRGAVNRYIFRETFKTNMVPSLYSCQEKSDPGRSCTYTIEQEQKWYAELVSKLNRDIWEKYIDFSKLLQLLNGKNKTMLPVDSLEHCYRLQIWLL